MEFDSVYKAAIQTMVEQICLIVTKNSKHTILMQVFCRINSHTVKHIQSPNILVWSCENLSMVGIDMTEEISFDYTQVSYSKDNAW